VVVVAGVVIGVVERAGMACKYGIALQGAFRLGLLCYIALFILAKSLTELPVIKALI
jgi:hypothetical protein